jgi:hypothetical protein
MRSCHSLYIRSSYICALFAIALLLPLGTAQAQARDWTLAQSSGMVSMSVRGHSLAVQPGDTIPAETVLTTGRDGVAVLALGSNRLTLSGIGRLHFGAQHFGGQAIAVADRGKLTVILDGAATIATPLLHVQADRASFSVTVTPGGASVQPGTGPVEVSTLDGAVRRTLQPGMIALVGADQPDQLIIDGSARGIIRAAVTLPAPPAGAPQARRSEGLVEIAAIP